MTYVEASRRSWSSASMMPAARSSTEKSAPHRLRMSVSVAAVAAASSAGALASSVLWPAACALKLGVRGARTLSRAVTARCHGAGTAFRCGAVVPTYAKNGGGGAFSVVLFVATL